MRGGVGGCRRDIVSHRGSRPSHSDGWRRPQPPLLASRGRSFRAIPASLDIKVSGLRPGTWPLLVSCSGPPLPRPVPSPGARPWLGARPRAARGAIWTVVLRGEPGGPRAGASPAPLLGGHDRVSLDGGRCPLWTQRPAVPVCGRGHPRPPCQAPLATPSHEGRQWSQGTQCLLRPSHRPRPGPPLLPAEHLPA